jgi:hypothetical protein
MLYGQTAASWQQIYGGPGIEAGYSVKSCLDQGYIVVGTTSASGPSDGYIVRTDSLGLVMWSKYYGGTNIDVLRSIEILSDSGFIVAGFTNSFGNGGYDGWILRLDKNGDTLWTQTIGTIDWDYFYDVAVTVDSGFIFVGGTYGAGMGDEDMLFLKTDSNGVLQWIRTHGGVKQDEARSVCVMGDSAIAACGFTYSLADTLGDSWILKLDYLTGDTIWTSTAHFNGQPDKAYGITNSTPLGVLFFCGSRETSPGNEDPYIDWWWYNGDSLYASLGGGVEDETYYDIATHPTGNYAAVGTNFSAGSGMGDMMMFWTYPAWSTNTYGTLELDQGYGIDVTHDGGYILCGSTEGYGCYQSNLYLVKTDSGGQFSTVLSIREATELNGHSTVFPNPATDEVTFTFDAEIGSVSELQLTITDVTGNIIYTSRESWNILSPKYAQRSLKVSTFADGVYFYHITDGEGNLSAGTFAVSH